MNCWNPKSIKNESVDIERQVLLEYQETYGWIAPKEISGRTECFRVSLPIKTVCSFIDKAISSQAKSTLLEGSETTGEIKFS